MSLKQVKLKWKFIPDNLQKFMPVEGTSTVNVEYGSIDVPTVSENSLGYTGSEINPNIVGYDSEKMELSGDTAAVEVGSYTLTFTPKYGYKWNDGSTEPKSITWSIENAEPSYVEFTVTADNRAKVGYTGTEGEELVIPATFVDPDDGVAYKVVAIGENAFNGCTNLTSVEIPEGVESIGSYTFADCGSLTSVTIPNTVTSIGGSAFNNTAWLTNKQAENPLVIVNDIVINGRSCTGDVVIPNNVKVIAPDSFFSSSGITSVTIPEGVESIGSRAFYRCTNMTSITIPSTVTTIGDGAFQSCNALDTVNYLGTALKWTTINIGSGNNTLINAYNQSKTYEDFVLDASNIANPGLNYTWEETYVIPETFINPEDGLEYKVVGIGERAFDGHNLTEITIPGSVKTIGNSAFENLIGLTTVTMLEGIETIGDNAFYNCIALNEINIPEGVTTIGDSAFAECANATTLTIPSSIVEIKDNAFIGCNALTTITYAGSEEDWYAINGNGTMSLNLDNITFAN